MVVCGMILISVYKLCSFMIYLLILCLYNILIQFSWCVDINFMFYMIKIFPIDIKGSAGSLVTVVSWVGSWIISFTFNFLMNWNPAGIKFV
jgi:hypothetical protein